MAVLEDFIKVLVQSILECSKEKSHFNIRKCLNDIEKNPELLKKVLEEVGARLLAEKRLEAKADQGFIELLTWLHPLLALFIHAHFEKGLTVCNEEMQRLAMEKEAKKEGKGFHIILPLVGTFRPWDTDEYAALGEKTDALKIQRDYFQGWLDRLAPLMLLPLPPAVLMGQDSRVVDSSVECGRQPEIGTRPYLGQ